MAREIPLTQGYVALVDDEDYERSSRYSWRVAVRRNAKYACRGGGDSGPIVYLHRFIMEVAESSVQVDHRNRNGLDCQKHNLRICNSAENGHNSGPRRVHTSDYKGVHWSKVVHNWIAQITNPETKKKEHIGVFRSQRDAALAYDRMARRYYGDFAYINIPEVDGVPPENNRTMLGMLDARKSRTRRVGSSGNQTL